MQARHSKKDDDVRVCVFIRNRNHYWVAQAFWS